MSIGLRRIVAIKVAFWFDAPAEYSGGLNYIRNLLYAISLVNHDRISPYVFFSSDISADIEAQFSRYASVVKTKLLQRGTAPWFIRTVLYKVFGSMILVNALLKSYGIIVVSHVWFVYKGRVPFHIIGWIPDFQYLHLPELFPTLDPDEETRQNQRIISQSEIVILSSYNALEDFKRIAAPETQSRGKVLQFVSQPRNSESPHITVTRDAIEQKYDFRGNFFFLPNQFWAHKNHIVVLQAVKLLKHRGINVLVLCTGNVKDYRTRSTNYINSIYEFIEANDLQDNVKILGHIDYNDVLFMMKNSLAVLNPSRFEGWSSSVEEAKSMGKSVILSRIGVHVEQNPPNGRYFDPDDAVALSHILAEAWSAPADASHDEAEQMARDALQKRTVEFGKAYLGLLNGVMQRAALRPDSGSVGA
jgi:glycosyltransferase involved in cell wall biosynthesis